MKKKRVLLKITEMLCLHEDAISPIDFNGYKDRSFDNFQLIVVKPTKELWFCNPVLPLIYNPLSGITKGYCQRLLRHSTYKFTYFNSTLETWVSGSGNGI
jgi:hypothetical protein